MASKGSLVLVFAILATSMLISLAMADSRDLSENTVHTEDKNTKNGEGLKDEKYPYGPGGGYGRGGYGGGPGYGGGGYGGGPGYGGGGYGRGGYGGGPGYGGGGYGRGGYGGYPGGRGGYCRFGCCRRGYYGGCMCCMTPNEIPEQEYRPEIAN